MSYGDNGDNRDGAWIFTCDRWRAQGCYIALPINPESISIPHALRAEQGQTKRGKIMYIQREHSHLGTSVFQPFDLSFSISSGNILPQFSPEYIADTANASRAIQAYNAKLRENDYIDATRGRYQAEQAKKLNFTQRVPGYKQTADYTAGKIFSHIKTRKASEKQNLPDLYQKDVPIGIQNLYAFIALADEQRFYKNSPNKIRVFIDTLAFPGLMLTCAFGTELQWTETAENPGEVMMNFTLRVINTTPRFTYGNLHQFFNNYQAFLTKNSSNLDFAIQAFDKFGGKS